jgi:hypothetical protein
MTSRVLDGREASNAYRIDCVVLRPLQVHLREASRARRIEQRNRKALRSISRSGTPWARRAPREPLRLVSSSNKIRWYGSSIFISQALNREVVGVLPVSDDVAEVYFGPILLGTLCRSRPELGLVRPEAKRTSGR